VKLPFKIPSIKMPKLPGFGKKKKPSGDSGESGGDDDLDQFDEPGEIEDSDDSDESKSSKKGKPSGLLGKLSKIKFSGIKFPKFGKKKSGKDDDDDLDFSEFEGMDDLKPSASVAPAEAGDAGPAAEQSPAAEGDAVPDGPPETPPDGGGGPAEDVGDLEDIDFGDDDDDEGGEGGGKPKDKKKLILIASAGLAVLVIGGASWFFLTGDGGDGKRVVDPDVPLASIDLPPPGRASNAGSLNAIIAGDKGPGAGVVVPVAIETAFANMLSPSAAGPALAEPTDETMIENSPQGPLPKISSEGRTPMQVFSRPFDGPPDGARLAAIVTGLGFSKAVTQAAIDLLPSEVALAFNPYAPNINEWAMMARTAGHEVLIMVPLEPDNFPLTDPGPQALMTFNAEDENRFRLEFLLSRMSGYVGMMTFLGSKYNKSEDHVRTLLDELRVRGLMFIEGAPHLGSLAPALATEMGVPRAVSDLMVDEIPSNVDINAKLAELEKVILDQKAVVIQIGPYPISIRRLATWMETLGQKNIALAPITALADRQKLIQQPTQ